MTRDGSGGEPPDEFAHLFRPDPVEPDDHLEDSPAPANEPPADPFSDWEPLVAVPQATPQGGMRFEDPPLPASSLDESGDGSGDDAPVDDAPVDDVLDAEVLDVEEDVEEVERPVDAAPAGTPIADPKESDPKEGRLFRSRGAPEREDAIVAVGSMQARRLRTLARADEPGVVQPPEREAEAQEPALAPILPVAASGEPAPALQVMAVPPAANRVTTAKPRSTRKERRDDRERTGSGSLTGLGVYAVTIGVTLILAFGETFLFGGEPGIITGIGLLVVSVFAAFTVRTYDGIHAIFAPAIAFLIVSLTAGQMGITATGLTGRAVVVFFLLGSNWIWILGSTAAALVIVALRRRIG